MIIKVERYIHNHDETIGRLYIKDEEYCFTLEDEKRTFKVYGETRIPEGIYKIKLRKFGGFNNKYLKRFGKDFHKGMIHIQDVPGFEYILIHCGNTDKDTAGCILVGSGLTVINNKNQLVQSETAYKKIYPIIVSAIEHNENVYIEIVSI